MDAPKTSHDSLKRLKDSQPMRKILLCVGVGSALTMSLQNCKTTDNTIESNVSVSLETQGEKTKKLLEDTIYDLKNDLILANDNTYIDKGFTQKEDTCNQPLPFEDKGNVLQGMRKNEYKLKIDRYQEEQNQILSPLSIEEIAQIEKTLAEYTIRCEILKDRPPMRDIKYIALHSTGTTRPEVITYLWKTGKVHYMILQDGSIIQYLASDKDSLAQQNHLGKGGDPYSCASRDKNNQMTFETIGIEVLAGPAKSWGEKEYESLKLLLRYLSNKYNIRKGDIISHTMVAYNPTKGMMRKYDPFELDRKKLDLPPNDIQINKEVLAGRIAPNLISMYKRLRKGYRGSDPGPGYDHKEAIDYLENHYAGVNYAILLHKDANNGKINPSAHLAKENIRWLSIQELDSIMKKYTPPVEKTKQIKGNKKTSYAK